MTATDFVYTTYIKSTPEKIWAAITTPEFTRQYWGHDNVSDWKKGSEWKHVNYKTGEVTMIGKVIESMPPKRLTLTWAKQEDLSDSSRVTFEIETVGDMVCLNVTHGGFKPDSNMAPRVAIGWPRVLSSMKSLLETGKALDTWAGHTMSCDASAKGAAA